MVWITIGLILLWPFYAYQSDVSVHSHGVIYGLTAFFSIASWFDICKLKKYFHVLGSTLVLGMASFVIIHYTDKAAEGVKLQELESGLIFTNFNTKYEKRLGYILSYPSYNHSGRVGNFCHPTGIRLFGDTTS